MYEYCVLDPRHFDAEQLEEAINARAEKGFRFVSYMQIAGGGSLLMERETRAVRTTDSPSIYEAKTMKRVAPAEKEDPVEKWTETAKEAARRG